MRTMSGTSAMSALTTLFTVFALMACGGDGSTDPGGNGGGGGGGNGGGGGGGGGEEPAEPAALVLVSGDGQTAKTLEAAGSPFVVRVDDADGAAVSGVTVTWSVTSGPGSVTTSSTTNTEGRAQATFTGGTTLGTSTVTASVSGVAETVEFGVETNTVVIRMQNTAFVAPGGGSDVTVPVGTTVEWVNRDDGLQHTATSSAAPAGGADIQTGLMSYQERRSFTPDVEGTWTYFCQVHPVLMAGATITATAE